MPTADDFSSYVSELLLGSYDCVDRIVLRAYYPMGQTSGGFLTWWNALYPKTEPTQERLRQMAGDFSRRVRAFGQKHQLPVQYCEIGDKTKHARAEKPGRRLWCGRSKRMPRVKCWSDRPRIGH